MAIKVKKGKISKDLYISKIRSVVSKSMSEKKIQKSIMKKVKENKCTYTPEFVALIA